MNASGAVGLLSVILLTTLVLIFMLTVSLQVLLNIKNAKLSGDFNNLYYVTEGGLRDARIQLKNEAVLSKVFADVSLNGVVVTRSAAFGLSNTLLSATGTAGLIQRTLSSTCEPSMVNCATTEIAP